MFSEAVGEARYFEARVALASSSRHAAGVVSGVALTTTTTLQGLQEQGVLQGGREDRGRRTWQRLERGGGQVVRKGEGG